MKKYIILLFILGFSSIAVGQTTDTQLWTGPVLKYNINNKFRLDFEQQLRFNENISNYDFTFSELAFRYKVFKYLNLKALYRYSFIPAGESVTANGENDASRVSIDASTGTEIFKTGINVGYRLMYQDSWDNTTMIGKHYVRTRFDISYNLCKLVDPYADWESYFRFDGKNQWRQHRYTFGLNWRVTKKIDIDSYFRYQKEINVNHPEMLYIWGLALVYSIN
jgi:hypothetical protein